jgi:sec-independent protein translocase protein TatB
VFGIGFFELLIIFLVVILFVNPKDLPKLFRKLGRFMRQIRDLKDSSVQYLKKVEREIEEADGSSSSDTATEESEHKQGG